MFLSTIDAVHTKRHPNHRPRSKNDDLSIVNQQQEQHPNQYPPNKYLALKQIIILRHGEFLGNIDEHAYTVIPDWMIPLTRRVEQQALRAAYDSASLLSLLSSIKGR
jgi:hypothetical protein